MTCHRAQGQSLTHCSIASDLSLDNPDRQILSDIRSILYVALTRFTQFKNILVSHISPHAWQCIPESYDNDMVDVETTLTDNAKEFDAQKVISKLNYQSD